MGRDDTYDLVSIFFLTMSAFVCIMSLMVMGNLVAAGPFEPEDPTETATTVALGTATPTPTVPTATEAPPTPTPTQTATFTPFPTQTPTSTASQTITLTPTDTLSPTPLGRQPIGTPLPTNTPVPSATESPTIEPPEFPIEVQPGTPLFLQSYTVENCEWQGIAGQVILSEGVPAEGYIVRVTGDGIDGALEAVTGSSPDYGSSGWEIQVADGALPLDYQVQVFDETGTRALSDVVEVNFTGECSLNLARVNFRQIAPF